MTLRRRRALALGRCHSYSETMSGTVRRLTAVLFALALTFALGTQGLRAAQMNQHSHEMAGTIADHASGPITDCPAKSKKLPLDCSAIGCGLIALAVTETVLPRLQAAVPIPDLGTALIGRGNPPEPYPPRTTYIG